VGNISTGGNIIAEGTLAGGSVQGDTFYMGNNGWHFSILDSVPRFYFESLYEAPYDRGGLTCISGGAFNSNDDLEPLVAISPFLAIPNSSTAIIFTRTSDGAHLLRVHTNGHYHFKNTQYYNSDIRIKKEIEDINDDAALQMILAIEPKTYKYIDVNRSKHRVYGFIAQQIKEVIPEAVIIDTNFIPNVYKLCRCEENKRIFVVLPSDAVGKLIQLESVGQYKIVLVEDEYIEVEKHMKSKDIPDGDNMVYGYEVNDMHNITPEYIFTLNVCATQELHRRILSQEHRIQELEAKMADIVKYLSL
jgi:hypothetical protein